MRAFRILSVLALTVLASSPATVHATKVENISDTFEAGDTVDFVAAGGSVATGNPGTLDGSVLIFNSAGNAPVFGYDAIRFELFDEDLVPRHVSLGFDIETKHLLGSSSQFTVLADTPSVRNLVFRSNGDIEVFNPGPGASHAVGNYADGAARHIDMLLDIVADRWTVSIDDALVYDDVIGGSTIGSIRFAIGAASGDVAFDPAATAFIDNIAIRTTDSVASSPTPVPLPAALGVMAGALPWLLRRRRKSGSSPTAW